MITEVIGGLSSGFIAADWLERFVFPAAVGFVACGELFFNRRASAEDGRQALRKAGMAEHEIKTVEDGFNRAFKSLGGASWKLLYPWQFIWSYVTAFFFTLVASGVKALLTSG